MRLLAFLFLSLPLFAQSLQVRTLAGSTTGGGFSDGVGTAARFSAPWAVAADGAGNILVADTGNHVIRRITVSGEVTTVAGVPGVAGFQDGPTAIALFRFPAGVTVDRTNGTIYVSDKDNHVIRTITPDGVVSTIAGAPGEAGSADAQGSAARFAYPRGLEVGTDGALYVADTGNQVIRRVTLDGTATTFAGRMRVAGSLDGALDAARFNGPSDVAVDRSTGAIYVADTLSNRIRRIANGTVSTVAGSAEGLQDGSGASARFSQPWSVDVDSSGNVYVADYNNAVIRRVTAGGSVSTLAGANAIGSRDGIGTAAQFNGPAGLAVGANDTLYVADAFSHAIRRIAVGTGEVSTLAGSKPQRGYLEGRGTEALFRFPYGVAADAAGNVYVAEDTHIRKIAPDGMTSVFAGMPSQTGFVNGAGTSARFGAPTGLAFGPGGILYVADNANHAIRAVTPAGVVSTFATGSDISSPWGVAVDGQGNVYVTNFGNDSISVITPGGSVSKLAGGTRGFLDGTGAQARFSLPSGITVDGSGNVYVADFENNAIRKIRPGGAVTTLVGTSAGLVRPSGVVSDAAGNLFVSDYMHMIYRVDTSGAIRVVAGSPSMPGNVDGYGARARFFFPEHLALTPGGELLIADSFNHAIRIASLVIAKRRTVRQ